MKCKNVTINENGKAINGTLLVEGYTNGDLIINLIKPLNIQEKTEIAIKTAVDNPEDVAKDALGIGARVAVQALTGGKVHMRKSAYAESYSKSIDENTKLLFNKKFSSIWSAVKNDLTISVNGTLNLTFPNAFEVSRFYEVFTAAKKGKTSWWLYL